MCAVSFVGWRFTTWSVVLVLLVLCSVINQATAQLNLLLSPKDAKGYMKMDFPSNLYLLEAGVPTTLVQNPGAFYSFMAPIKPSVSELRFNWFSTPQVSHYSMKLKSSNTMIMADPVTSIPLEGIVEQSTTAFSVSFVCTGKKEGEADMRFSLNYTAIESGLGEDKKTKEFELVVRRLCLKTDGEEGGNGDDTGTVGDEVSSSPWSRSMVVGLCAGLTLVIILVMGLVLLCRYSLRQRKLKMEFEDDLEMYRNSSSKIYKKSHDEEVDELGDPRPGVIYNPPKRQLSYPEAGCGHSSTSSSGIFTALVIPEDEFDAPVHAQPEGKSCNRDSRPSSRQKHKKYDRAFKGDSKLSWIPEQPSSYHETESLLERRNTPDEAQNMEGLFSALNELWSVELAGLLLSREQVSLGEPLKRGTFGYLYKGTVRGLNEEQPRKKNEVSIKFLQDEADMDTITSFVQEAMIIKDLQHPNVVKLVGVVLQRATPPYIITPSTKNGDLSHFLKISRATSARPQMVTSCQLINFGVQISSGMDYVSQKQIVHRNLAATSCIVENDLTIKITDFSLARDVNSTSVNDKGIHSRLHIKWTAPESLKDGHFTEKSDVWSFGVVLWELVTLAKAPYQAIDSSKMQQHLQAGHRLAQPGNCPCDLYFLMKNCWEANPVERPTFNLLTKQLEHYIGRLVQNRVKFEYLPESNC